MGRKLTLESIRQRNSVDDPSQVVDLNLWANDLEDVSILKDMPNVETISLSLNHIRSLKPFQYCLNLKELYLRKNKVDQLAEIKYLKGLSNLKVLWLWDNPCCNHPHYRKYIIKLLPSLEKLDNAVITTEERMDARKIDLNAIENEEIPSAPMEVDKHMRPHASGADKK